MPNDKDQIPDKFEIPNTKQNMQPQYSRPSVGES
jgi:hypothetical protein